jgi:hypothetical protein
MGSTEKFTADNFKKIGDEIRAKFFKIIEEQDNEKKLYEVENFIKLFNLELKSFKTKQEVHILASFMLLMFEFNKFKAHTPL